VSKLLTAAAAAFVLAALVAGCGGGDETTDETVTLTKTEFIKQGDAICKKGNDESEKEAKEFAEENGFDLEKASNEQLEEAVSEVLVSNLNGQVEELDALGAPEGDEDQVEEIVVSLEGAVEEIEDDPGVVFDGKVLEEPGELAQDYGFKVCGAE
jgi:ABC-type glycerol-3-phosphate transport system substrate-binding protein